MLVRHASTETARHDCSSDLDDLVGVCLDQAFGVSIDWPDGCSEE